MGFPKKLNHNIIINDVFCSLQLSGIATFLPGTGQVGVAISLEYCLLLPYFKSIIAIFGSHHLNSALKMRGYRFLIVLWCYHLWITPFYFYYLSPKHPTNPKTHLRDPPSSERYRLTFPQIIQPSYCDLWFPTIWSFCFSTTTVYSKFFVFWLEFKHWRNLLLHQGQRRFLLKIF